MKKFILVLSFMLCIFTLSGCNLINEILFPSNNINISNSSLMLKDNVYTLEFTLDDDNYFSQSGIVDVKIISNYNTLYSNVFNFDVTEDNTYYFYILVSDIEISSKREGTFEFTITINKDTFSMTYNIDDLVYNETLYESSLNEAIEKTSSDVARGNIIKNNWANHDTSTVTNMLSLYDKIDKELKKFMLSEINVDEELDILTLDTYDYELNRTELYETFNAVLYDNPIYYFVSKNSSTLSFTNNPIIAYLTLYTYEEYSNGLVRTNYNAMILAYLNECSDLIKDLSSDLDICLTLHDKIIKEVDYNYNFDIWAHNILGVVAKEGPVCESYAESYFMLLNYFDIPCYVIVGTATQYGKVENHAWNLVYINNSWYHIDLTWNDMGDDKVGYTYFGLGSNSSTLNKTHLANKNELAIVDNVLYYMIDLPKISSTDLDIN